MGRPWLFADLARVFDGRPPLGPPRLADVAPAVIRHLRLALEWYGDEVAAVRGFRKHLRWYLQGYPVGAATHRRAGLVSTAADVAAVVDALEPGLHVVGSAVRAPRGRTGPLPRLVLPDGWCDDNDAAAAVVEPALAVSGG